MLCYILPLETSHWLNNKVPSSQSQCIVAALQICQSAKPTQTHKHTHPRHSSDVQSHSVVWTNRCVMCLWELVRACYFLRVNNVSSLPRSHAATSRLSRIQPGLSHCVSELGAICIVIFTAYYGDTLLWCDTARRAITRPGEGVRPLSVRRDVNKLSLIPGCMSNNTHAPVQMWSYARALSHHDINQMWNNHIQYRVHS